MRGMNIPVDGYLPKEQTNCFALKLIITNFKASDGWSQKFKSRHGLSFRKLCGESGTANTKLANELKEGELKALLSEYAPEDVFNADETSLFFKMLPERTLTSKGENCSGGKKAKQRILILLAANMNGTQKLSPLFIGKYLKPRCFKNVNKLLAAYHANRNAWMTGHIYEKWLRDLDRRFLSEKRKILLIVDNCSAHVEVSDLKDIRKEFLRPNVTSILQPMDQSVINSFRRIHRRVLLQRVVMGLELEQPYEIDVLSAMHLSIRAWNDVQETTISKAFQHAGFTTTIEESQENVPDNMVEDELLINELRKRNPLMSEISFQDFLNVDSDVICTEEISDEKIIVDIMNEKEELSDFE
ncbi:Tigger transposable element-derived protein 6 [Araneus ventricosus]|uniref:Tigger transposable element-derived protein 6 n=1 Tax=Araneus ventricosus TaxID=182803 RepID=A0A4Y2A474_ARAVE|nr:Tigger transposable element-derived protein 6 [Araneus ventricosus]